MITEISSNLSNEISLIFGYTMLYNGGEYTLLGRDREDILKEIKRYKLLNVNGKYYFILKFKNAGPQEVHIYEVNKACVTEKLYLTFKGEKYDDYYIGLRIGNETLLINVETLKLEIVTLSDTEGSRLTEENLVIKESYSDEFKNVFLAASYYDFLCCLNVFCKIEA